MITLGSIFYDDRNGRYITPDGVGCDPKVYSCVVEEFDEYGNRTEVGRQLFKENELRKFLTIREV